MPSLKSLSLLGLLLLTGCGSQAVTFNNQVAKATRDLDAANQNFVKTLRQEKEPAQWQAAHAALVTRVDAILAAASLAKAPEGQEAREFLAAFQGFLKNQERLVKVDFKELLDARARDNQARIQEVGDRITRVGQEDQVRLREAQAAFARAHKITLPEADK